MNISSADREIDAATIAPTGSNAVSIDTGDPSDQFALKLVGNLDGTSGSGVLSLNDSHSRCAVVGNVVGGVHTATIGIGSSASYSSVSISGDVSGGAGPSGTALWTTGDHTDITVTGSVSGGSHPAAYGIRSSSANTSVSIVGNLSGAAAPALRMGNPSADGKRHGRRCGRDLRSRSSLRTGVRERNDQRKRHRRQRRHPPAASRCPAPDRPRSSTGR